MSDLNLNESSSRCRYVKHKFSNFIKFNSEIKKNKFKKKIIIKNEDFYRCLFVSKKQRMKYGVV